MTDVPVTDETTTADVEQKILDAVAKIREHWHELLEIPEGGRAGSPSTDTLTALERRLTLRQDVDRLLADACRLVIRDRPLTTVHLRHTAETDRMLRLLETHARWLSGHEDAERVAGRLARRAREVELTARPPARDHVLLGECPFVVEDDQGVASWHCYGRVQAKIGGDGYASCTGCRRVGLIEWWEDVLGLNLRPVTLPSLVPILHARLGLRVTDRTLRNWRRAGLIVPAMRPEDHVPVPRPPLVEGIGPVLVWDLFDPREVIARAADMGRACALCGKPWQGGGDVCRACWVSTQHAQPGRAIVDERPHIAGVPVTMRPRVLQPKRVDDPHDDDRPERCHYGDLPLESCQCGNPLAEEGHARGRAALEARLAARGEHA